MAENEPGQPALDNVDNVDNVDNGKRGRPSNATQHWRAQSNAYRAVYLERMGKPLPPAAVPLPRPARRALSLLLLALTAFFFVLCAAVSLVILQPNSSPPADVPRQATPIFPHATATRGNTIILPGVTFTTETPAIVEPVGGGQGLPYVTPTTTTTTGGAVPTATPNGTPWTGGGGPPSPLGPPGNFP